MGKIVKGVAAVVGVAALLIPGVGAAISGAIASAISGATIAGIATVTATGAAIGTAVTGALIAVGLSSAFALAGKAFGLGPKPPKRSPASEDRLRASLEPRAQRKIVFGYTAAATDVHYQEFTGTDQEYLNSIVTLASHALHAIEEIWFDETLAWTSPSTISATFTGYLTVTDIEQGTTANAFTITGSTSWTAAASRMVGLAYVLLRYKLTGNTKKAESPFSSGPTSRITFRVRGAKLYDPRLDSTVPGGAGAHRADDQTTWAWVSDNVGRNPALQLLWYLLGWKIQNPVTLAWKLACGLGVPKARIDMPSFIAAANVCDEAVTLSGGGTEPRYRSDGVFSEGDDPSLVFENLLAACNGVLRDNGGSLAIDILVNDLATPDVDLTEADIVGDFAWLQTPPLDQSINYVRGRYVDASNTGLYQPADYPDISITSPDGIERSATLELAMVQSASQAQRLAKQFLQRAQYPGTFAANFLASAWRCQVGSVIRLTFPALGFTTKLFRVVEHSIRFDGTCPMVLREENAAIYAWDASETAPVVPAAPIRYDPINDPFVQAIQDLDAVATNFNARNDRNATAVVAPTIVTDGTAVDHILNNIGLAEMSFEYAWGGTEADIDGFEIRLYASTSSAAYTPGSSPVEEQKAFAIPNIRGTKVLNVDPKLYYTWMVRAYRIVDPDINSSGFLFSAWVKPSLAGENPYQPSTSVSIPDAVLIGGSTAINVATWASYANTGLNSDGTVKTDKVVTASIQANQVTNLTSAFTAAAQASTYNTWITVQTVTFTSTGTPDLIMWTGGAESLSAESAAAFLLRIQRNGSTIWDGSEYFGSIGNNSPSVVSIIDTPGSGSVTYTVQFNQIVNGIQAQMVDRSLSVLETKR